MLIPADRPLTDLHDLIVLDCDGVVYIGDKAVPHAARSLDMALAAGSRIAYVTNNSSRTPEQVSAKLAGFGLPGYADDVVTSSQAAARMMRELVGPGSHVFVIGGVGLEEALRSEQLVPVTEPSPDVRGVAQGYGPDMPWRQLISGAILVRSGLPWVATNTDLTVPTSAGFGPGNGTLVKLVAEYADRIPPVAGKPERPLLEETVARVGGTRPMMVGDRLDTDIEGARRMGWESLLVMTGVTDLDALVRARPHERPSYIGLDLRDLHVPHPVPEVSGAGWALGGWLGAVERDHLVVSGDGSARDWWRVVATTAWDHLDSRGEVAQTHGVQPPR